MASRLWLKTELAFMYIRANPDLDKVAIGRVISAAVDEFEDHVNDALGAVRSGPGGSLLDEPAHVASRMTGAALAARSALNRCATENAADVGYRLGTAALGRFAVFDEREKGRLARGVYEGVAAGAEAAASTFAAIAAGRPSEPPAIAVIGSTEINTTMQVVDQLRRLRKGENVSGHHRF